MKVSDPESTKLRMLKALRSNVKGLELCLRQSEVMERSGVGVFGVRAGPGKLVMY